MRNNFAPGSPTRSSPYLQTLRAASRLLFSKTRHIKHSEPLMQSITPCLWFDNQAEEAANFYVSIFKNSRITKIQRYTEVGKEHHGKPAGSVMVAAFEINGQPFTALNGGPIFKLSEAVSFQVMCDNQEEVDYYWEKLSAGGDPKAQACGWLKD